MSLLFSFSVERKWLCAHTPAWQAFGREGERNLDGPEIPFPYEHLPRRLRAPLEVRETGEKPSPLASHGFEARASTYIPTILVGKHETARRLLVLEGLYFEGISFFWVS